MLSDQIDKAKTDEKEMMELISKFNPLLKKYAAKLNYEDAYSDILLYFIELIKSFNLNHISCLEDAAAVSYINVSIKNFYCKKLQKIIKMKKEIVLSSLTEEQKYYAEAQLAKEDKEDIFVKVDIRKMLSRNEYRIIYLIYYLATRSTDGGKTLRYQPVIGCDNYILACQYLQKCGYATAINYDESLINDYIEKYDLVRFDQ